MTYFVRLESQPLVLAPPYPSYRANIMVGGGKHPRKAPVGNKCGVQRCV